MGAKVGVCRSRSRSGTSHPPHPTDQENTCLCGITHPIGLRDSEHDFPAGKSASGARSMIAAIL